MNIKLIFKLIGNMLKIEAVFMLFPLVVSFLYGDGDHWAFLWPILITVVLGILLSLIKPQNNNFRAKDACVVAGVSWVLFSLFGALPFYFSGYFNNFVDCAFESISGFTTTGATILTDIEILPRGILLWRSFSHWIGGMGVLMFLMAVLPSLNATSVNLLRVESTGPAPDKVVPKIRETAKIMYLIYLSMTIILFVLLLITGLPVYDSLISAFSTAGTGGFSNMNASIGAYGNIAAEIIITIFMFLFGISFSLYFILLGREFKRFFLDEELRMYFYIVIASILIITFNTIGIYGSFGDALRNSSFQVSSIISTTGFSTADFNYWPTLSQAVLVCLMFLGCCAGSTGGGMKLVRILILMKGVKNEIGKILHPGIVKPVLINKKKVSQDILSRTSLFFFIYLGILTVSTMLVSLDGKDIVSSITAVIASLGNIGPGLGINGPIGNYSSYLPFSKIVLSACMIAGRLELIPMLILLTPSAWKSRIMK